MEKIEIVFFLPYYYSEMACVSSSTTMLGSGAPQEKPSAPPATTTRVEFPISPLARSTAVPYKDVWGTDKGWVETS